MDQDPPQTDEVTEKEILIEIFRQLRWIARVIAVVLSLAIVAIGAGFLLWTKSRAGL